MTRQTCKISPIVSHSKQNKIQSHLLFSDLAALLIMTVVVVALGLCYGQVQVCSEGRWGRWQQLAWGMILLQLALIQQQQKLLLWSNTMLWEGKWLQQFMFWNTTNSIMQTRQLAIRRQQTAEKRNPDHFQHLLEPKHILHSGMGNTQRTDSVQEQIDLKLVPRNSGSQHLCFNFVPKMSAQMTRNWYQLTQYTFILEAKYLADIELYCPLQSCP